MIEGILIALAPVALTGTAVGLFKLTGLNTRVAVLERAQEDQLTLVLSKLEDISQRLGRVERSLNGYIKHDH